MELSLSRLIDTDGISLGRRNDPLGRRGRRGRSAAHATHPDVALHKRPSVACRPTTIASKSLDAPTPIQ